MEKQFPVGTEGMVDVKLEGGFVILGGKYDGSDMDVNLEVKISVDNLLDKLAAKIPGQVDDAVIGLLKAALKAV